MISLKGTFKDGRSIMGYLIKDSNNEYRCTQIDQFMSLVKHDHVNEVVLDTRTGGVKNRPSYVTYVADKYNIPDYDPLPAEVPSALTFRYDHLIKMREFPLNISLGALNYMIKTDDGRAVAVLTVFGSPVVIERLKESGAVLSDIIELDEIDDTLKLFRMIVDFQLLTDTVNSKGTLGSTKSDHILLLCGNNLTRTEGFNPYLYFVSKDKIDKLKIHPDEKWVRQKMHWLNTLTNLQNDKIETKKFIQFKKPSAEQMCKIKYKLEF